MNNLVKFIVISAIFLGVAIAITFGVERSSQWEHARLAHMQIEAVCQWCGSDKHLEVHHIKPFHEHPELELDQKNMITLCRFCHFTIGHNCDWSRENIYVRKDCEYHASHVK
jgi:hypothetical protein